MNKKFLCLTLADQVTVNGSSGYIICMCIMYMGWVTYISVQLEIKVSELQPVIN